MGHLNQRVMAHVSSWFASCLQQKLGWVSQATSHFFHIQFFDVAAPTRGGEGRTLFSGCPFCLSLFHPHVSSLVKETNFCAIPRSKGRTCLLLAFHAKSWAKDLGIADLKMSVAESETTTNASSVESKDMRGLERFGATNDMYVRWMVIYLKTEISDLVVRDYWYVHRKR